MGGNGHGSTVANPGNSDELKISAIRAFLELPQETAQKRNRASRAPFAAVRRRGGWGFEYR